jgi:hypothetical protein
MNFLLRKSRKLPRIGRLLFSSLKQTWPKIKCSFSRWVLFTVGAAGLYHYSRSNLVFCADLDVNRYRNASRWTIIIYSAETNKPVATGVVIQQNGVFLTIPNFLSSEPEDRAPSIGSRFYCKCLNNPAIAMNFEIDLLLPDDGVMFCKITGIARSQTFSKSADLPEFDSMGEWEGGITTGKKAYLCGRTNNDMPYIADHFITESMFKPSSINPEQHISANPGVCFTLNTRDGLPYAMYGGPVLDDHGRILGISFPYDPRLLDGQTLVLPSWFLGPLIHQYRSKKGAVKRPYLGMTVKTGQNKGAFVIRINAESPAAAAGLKLGDTVLDVNNVEVNSASDLVKVIGYNEGVTIPIKIERDGKTRTLNMAI